VLNIQKSGNDFAIDLGETEEILKMGRTRNVAIVNDALMFTGEYTIRFDSSTGLVINTDSNGGGATANTCVWLARDGVVHTQIFPDGRYLLGVGNGTSGAASCTIRAEDDTFQISPNGNLSQGLAWNATYNTMEFLEAGVGILARSPAGTLYRLAPPNGGGAATWVAP